MTNKEELKKQLVTNLGIVEQRKKIVAMIENKEIAIDWETDVSKIDLSVLRSFNGCKEKFKLRIEPFGVESYGVGASSLFCNHTSHNFLNDDKQIIELIELIQSKVKIIPPLFYLEHKYVNGELIETSTKLSFRDGSHRLRIAAALKLETIPVLVYDHYEHIFDLDSHCFDVGATLTITTL